MAGLDTLFSNVGGAVSDLYAAKGYGFKAQGFRLQAQGYRLQGEGDEIEKQNYLKAGEFADQNVEYTRASTAIKQQQEDRQNLKLIGGQQADVAGAGFAASGSALDLLRDSASEGSRIKQVLGFQGQITEAGYEEQGRALRSQADAAGIAEQMAGVAAQGSEVAAQAADTAAQGANISAGIHAVAALFSFSGLNMGGGGGGGSPDGT